MAKKKTQHSEEKRHFCEDCAHAFDPHELDWKREPFLCKCPFFQWSRFLHKDTCDKFLQKGQK